MHRLALPRIVYSVQNIDRLSNNNIQKQLTIALTSILIAVYTELVIGPYIQR